MILPTAFNSSKGRGAMDSDEQKYNKKMTLRRSMSSVGMWGRRNQNSLMKGCIVFLTATLIFVLVRQRTAAVSINVDLEYQTVQNELESLGVNRVSADRIQKFKLLQQLREQEEEEEGEDEQEMVNQDQRYRKQQQQQQQQGYENDQVEFYQQKNGDDEEEEGGKGELAGGEEGLLRNKNQFEDDDEESDSETNLQVEASMEDNDSQPMQESETPDKPITEMTPDELFTNAKELEECGRIKLPFYKKRPTDWWLLKTYMKLYKKERPYACIPILRPHLQLSLDDFTQLFRTNAQPVLFHFENIRSLGFKMRSYTLDELQELFPFDPTKDKAITYKANVKYNDDHLELGPAIYAFKDDGKLVKTKGAQRNYPRNMKVSPAALGKLGVEAPPLVPGAGAGLGVFQSPSLWFGTSTAPTPMHSDCCDNFVEMVTGTKRFTLAPPTDWHVLSPKCVGKKGGLCYANLADPSAPGVRTSHFNKMTVDVHAGQILYLPAGYFHHVSNLGPTLMTNVWTRSKETFGAGKKRNFDSTMFN